MSNTLLVKFKLFCPQIWQQTVRHRGKLNVKIPRPRHDIPRYLEEITRPIIVRELPDPIDTCRNFKVNSSKKLKLTTNDAIEFERFLAGHALGLIQKYNVILVCHRLPSYGETVRRNKVTFKKNDTEMWTFNTITMRILMEENPKYANLNPIIESGFGRNFFFFCDEKNLTKNLNALKRMPHFLLLGGLIHDRLYTRNGVMSYANLEPLETQHAYLSNTLNQFLASTVNTLTTPIRSLSLALEQHAKAATTETSKKDETATK